MNAIELKSLKKSFRDFTLHIPELILPSGCILGLVGENGSGKSTTIKLILDILHADEGTIELLGQDTAQARLLSKQDVGVVLDDVGIPQSLKTGQVGKMMAGIYQNWDQPLYESYLRRFQLPDNKRFRTFSRGMKMKLGLAVALSHHAKLLLLDEATSGLDPVVRDEILDIFLEFTREADHSILISSHIVSDLEKLCDYIAFLHHGKLMLFEEKDRLLEEFGLLHCTADQLETLPKEAVHGKKESPYGVEALVERALLPTDMQPSAIDLEQLFIFMVKEDVSL